MDDALTRRLEQHFTEEQLVELGYFVSLTFGQQRWIKTLEIGHREVTVPTVTDEGAGLAADRASQ